MFDFVFALMGYQKELEENLKPAHEFTKAIIKERKATFVDSNDSNNNLDSDSVYFRSKKRRYAMMDTLLQAESQGLIDDDGIVEEVDTFTFEGHDTTSAAMTFTLLLLAHHPEAQEKILEELQSVQQENEDLSINDYNKLEYLDRVIKESMRIYPPVPFIARKFSEDFIHDGITYPKDSVAHIHIYDIHRDPDVFPDPEKFEPERFLPENCEGRNNFAFIAFSAGMRNCIGQKFAMLELKVMLAKVVSNFKILPVTSRDEVVFISDLVLRSRDPIKMKFCLRD
jgi:cytochrome P450 family 4